MSFMLMSVFLVKDLLMNKQFIILLFIKLMVRLYYWIFMI